MLRDRRAPLDSAASPNINKAKQTLNRKRMSWTGTLMGWMFVVCLLAQPGWGYSGGTGSLQAPYQIASADDLIELGQTPEDYDKHFLLTGDIDMAGHSFGQAVIAPSSGEAWIEIYEGDVFYGTINGNGHVIQNLTVSGSSNLGLIGIMGPYAQVYGLGVVDANIVGTDENAGMLAAYSEGRILNCYCTGSVSGNTQVGGLVGESGGYIADCFSQGQVSGTNRIGGLVGLGHAGDILNSYSTCVVSADRVTDGTESPPRLGGLVGLGGFVSNGFWDTQTSGITDTGTGRGTGLTTDQMQMIDTFLDAAWDFQGEVANGCRETWLMPEAGGYPTLGIFAGPASSSSADCGVPLGPCALPLDANEILWDSEDILVPNWDSLAVSRITRNPVESPEHDPVERDIVITVWGRVEILDPNNLIALDAQNSIHCQALDEQGNGVTLRHIGAPFEPRHCWDVLNTSPRPFTLQLQLDPNQVIPAELSQLDFYVYALYAQPLTVIDIPFKPMNDWMELWPGFRVIIETALLEDGTCEYAIKEEISGLSNSDDVLKQGYDLCGADELGWYRFEDIFTDRDLIYNRDMIDASGMPTSRNGGSRSSSSRKSGGMTSRTESGDWNECSGIAFIRYTIAVKPYKLVVPLTLRDIPVLGF